MYRSDIFHEYTVPDFNHMKDSLRNEMPHLNRPRQSIVKAHNECQRLLASM